MIVELVKYLLHTYEDLGTYPSSHVKLGTAMADGSLKL